jgi:3',5'-cyclic AMP phosphodiesterase CpdA
VQLVAKADATEADFAAGNVKTVAAQATQTKALRYTGICQYIVAFSGLAKNLKYKYISHKALATDLTPGTEYSWRCGYEGHWSPIARFRTEDNNQGEYSFIYMSDSHIMNPEYIHYARRCALAAVKTVPEARFCVFPGDFVEDGTVANSEWEWERWFEEALEPVIKQMPVVPTDGNHDDSPNINYTYHFNTDNDFNYTITRKPQFEGIVYNFVYGDALGKPSRGKPDWTLARRRDAENYGMPGSHAPDVRAVDARLRPHCWSEHAELHDERRVVHRLNFRAIGASEARVEPVGVRGIVGRPFAATSRLKDNLLRSGKIDMRLDRLLPELDIAGVPGNPPVGPDPELRRRGAIALLRQQLTRIVVNGDKRVEGLDLAVRSEHYRAFRMSAEATGIDVARHRERMAVYGLERQEPLAEPASRA